MSRAVHLPVVALATWSALAGSWSAPARADADLPPWTDPDDVPLPEWARSAAPKKEEVAVYTQPGRVDSGARRGSATFGARLPIYGTRRATQCTGRWLLVGPLAWVCSDGTDLSADSPGRSADGQLVGPDGLPFRYFFVGRDGTYSYPSLETAGEDQPEQDLEPGFAVAVVEERRRDGEAWGRTRHGKWIAMRDLGPANPSAFHGEELKALGVGAAKSIDLAWVVPDKAAVFASAKADKATGSRVRLQTVAWREERPAAGGAMVRISEDGAPAEWMRARDLAHPTIAAPPAEVGGAEAHERWIDVELASQTLVAYEGASPVFATLVSTGRGAAGSDTATPPGVARVWVKLLTTNMDNLEREDADRRYSIEDVPYVMFFNKGVALHGTFWHRDFGRVHSHGCVNLAPLDAKRLFDWTLPRLPAGWTAALPTALERGTLVRVR